MSFKTTLLAATAAFATTFALVTPAMAEGIMVQDAYARSSGPTAMAGAAFMVIHNGTDTDDRLIDARSDASARVELHTHIADADGVMRMVHVEEGFDLPAGADLILQRGSHHVMFMGLTDPFDQGELLSVTLVFENAGEIEVQIPVDHDRMPTDAPAMDMGADTMDHGAMDMDAEPTGN